RKTIEFTTNYFFARRSSAKIGWESDWFDRSHRDVAHSLENSVFGAVDYSPTRDLLFRISGRHQNRKPDLYQDPTASDPVTGVAITCTSTSVVFTEEQRCHRRFDEAARILDRGDLMVQYNLGRFTFDSTFQTIQTNFNQRGGSNSPAPLNFLAGSTAPYFLYGGFNGLPRTFTLFKNKPFFPARFPFFQCGPGEFYKTKIFPKKNTTPPPTPN